MLSSDNNNNNNNETAQPEALNGSFVIYLKEEKRESFLIFCVRCSRTNHADDDDDLLCFVLRLSMK